MSGAAGKLRNGAGGNVNSRADLGDTSWGRLMEQRLDRGRERLEGRRHHVLGLGRSLRRRRALVMLPLPTPASLFLSLFPAPLLPLLPLTLLSRRWSLLSPTLLLPTPLLRRPSPVPAPPMQSLPPPLPSLHPPQLSRVSLLPRPVRFT